MPFDVLILFAWPLSAIACLVAGQNHGRPTFTVLGWSALAGFVGLIGGFIEGMSRDGSYIGNANLAAWKVGTLVAGIGWTTAALIGLILTRHDRPASRGESWVLGVAAILSVVAAAAATHWYFALESFGDEIGLLGSFTQSLSLLHRLVWLDGAIVAAICLVLIFRNRGRQPAAA
jgi:peptidoglycan biosynthesis protein MviN/MurJ (putative lipid II flippase)